MLKGTEWIVAFLALGIGSSVGCGEGGSVPVEGKVALDGKPLANATVSFAPVKAGGPGPFVDETDSEGRFKLGSVGNEGSGAAVGEYFVYIITVQGDSSGMETAPLPTRREIVPTVFRDGSKRIDVPEGGKKDFTFDMRGR